MIRLVSTVDHFRRLLPVTSDDIDSAGSSEVADNVRSANKHRLVRYKNWTEEMHRFYDDIEPENLCQVGSESSVTVTGPATDATKASLVISGRHSYFPNSTVSLCCSICKVRGHKALECHRHLSKRVRCHLCGELHYYEDCPDGRCLRCGESGQPYSM